MPIEAVTFDLWNTLIANADYSPARLAALNEVMAGKGVTPPRVEAAHADMHELSWHRWQTPPHAYWSIVDRLDDVASRLGVSLHDGERDRLARAFEECIMDDPPPLFPRAGEVLDAVADAGRKIALVSDTGYSPGRIMRRVLEMHGVASRFDVMVFSDETGFHKPHHVMFSTALDALGVDAARAMHVGDIPRTDVAGAKQHGMIAAWIRQPGQEPAAIAAGPPDHVIEGLGDLLGILG